MILYLILSVIAVCVAYLWQEARNAPIFEDDPKKPPEPL